MRGESQPSSMCVVLAWYVIVLISPQVKHMSVYQEYGMWYRIPRLDWITSMSTGAFQCLANDQLANTTVVCSDGPEQRRSPGSGQVIALRTGLFWSLFSVPTG
jgi:hypothetical protein